MRIHRVFERLDIAGMVRAALVLPIIFALICSAILISPSVRDLTQARRIAGQMSLAIAISDLVHEQQKERGVTAVYLNSGRTAFKDELAAQRALTDERVADLSAAAASAGIEMGSEDPVARIIIGLEEHSAIRSRVDDGTIPTGEAVRYYTNSNGAMLAQIGFVASHTSQALLSHRLTEFFVFLLAKEQAGLERAVGAGGFASGEFPVKTLLNLQARISEQSFALAQLRTLVEPDHAELIDSLTTSNAADRVRALRQIAFDFPGTMSTGGITGPDFFKAKTAEIELMKDLETVLADEILMTADDLASRNMRLLVFLLAVVGVGAVLIFATTVMATRSINRHIGQIVTDADRMGAGEMDKAVQIVSPPDLRRIAQALESLRCSILEAQASARDAAKREEDAREAQLATERAASEAERDRNEQARIAAERITARDKEVAAKIGVVVSACAEGDFSRRVEDAARDGILSEVCEGMNRIGEAANEGLGAILEGLGALSKGDLTYRMPERFSGIFAEIATRANETSNSLNSVLGDIAASSTSVDGSAREISDVADDLARRTEQNAATLEQTAAALVELSSTVGSVADLAKEATVSATDILGKANAGKELVNSACSAMDEIQDATAAIAKILEVIDGIAFQTNLLALNAGVEAARAGDAGRGFAVVAAEVRALAQRSSEAARDIAGLIDSSGQVVTRGVDLVRDSGRALEQIVQSVADIEERTKGIASSARSAATGVSEITAATGNLDRATQQNAAMFEETNAAVQCLKDDAATLAGLVASFQLAPVDQAVAGVAQTDDWFGEHGTGQEGDDDIRRRA